MSEVDTKQNEKDLAQNRGVKMYHQQWAGGGQTVITFVRTMLAGSGTDIDFFPVSAIDITDIDAQCLKCTLSGRDTT